jgi:hypothetical protein
MTTLLHIAATADAVLAAITNAWAALGEIVTAGALLLALDRLAAAIRATYNLGRIAGSITWPAIHWTVKAGHWLWAHIDWRFTALVVADCLRVIAVFTVTVVRMALPALVRISQQLGSWYSRRLLALIDGVRFPDAAATITAAMPAAPVVEPAPLEPAPAKPAPRKRAARARKTTAAGPQPVKSASPAPRRRRSPAAA